MINDEPREWQLTEEGEGYEIVTACSVDEALAIARANVDRANYPVDECSVEDQRTIWIDVRVYCEATGEEGEATVQLDPDEPECTQEDGHDWSDDHDLVGGIESNPGVWAHGGGVFMVEACRRCGCGKVVDTWAQRPDDGTEGHTTVRYAPGRFADEVARLPENRLRCAIEALEEAGYSVHQYSGGGCHYVQLVVGEDDEDALAQLRAVIQPYGGEADWTGESNTEVDGTTTSDVYIEVDS